MHKKTEANVLGLIVGPDVFVPHIAFGDLIRHAGLQIALARLHAERLDARGWVIAKTERLRAELANLSTLVAEQLEDKEAVGRATREVKSAIAELQRFRRRLVAALRVARLGGVVEDNAAPFAGRAFTRRTSGALAWCVRVSTRVRRLDAALAPMLLVEKPSTTLEALSARLRDAVRSQGLAARAEPRTTAEMKATRARVFVLLRQLAGVAVLAFEHEPELGRAFHLPRLPAKAAANDDQVKADSSSSAA